MLLLGDPERKKKIATIIVGKISGGYDKCEDMPEEKMEESEESDMDSAMKAAASGVMSSIKDGDTEKLADSLMAFFQCCYSKMEESEEVKEAYNNEVG